MTLPERITLINSLIKEDRDHTIRDYLDTVAEIEQINPPIKEPVMMPRTFTEEQEAFILHNHVDMTVKEMAGALTLQADIIYNFCHRYKLKYKRYSKPPVVRTLPAQREKAFVPDAPRVPIVRPAAEYNNLKSNYA